MSSEGKCPEVTTFQRKQTVGMLSPVPGALSRSSGFERINQDTAVLCREQGLSVENEGYILISKEG